MLNGSAKIVVRLGGIGIDETEMTRELSLSIRAVFSNARLLQKPARSEILGRQTKRFLPKSKGCLFEMDYMFAV